MTTPTRIRATLAVLLLSLLAAAAPAAAATIPDATGDATDGDPGHDITQFDWSYDPGGVATGSVTVAGPGADAGIAMSIGPANADGTCSQTDGVLLIGVKSITDQAAYTIVTAGAAGPNQAAQRGGSGQTYTVTATDPQLAGKAFTCAEAQLTDPENTSVVYDSAVAPAAPAPTPTPTPTPAPTAAPPAPTPAPQPAAKLRSSLSKVPARVKRGQTFRPRLTVRNAGNAASKRVTVKFRSARGLSVKPGKVTIKSLAPGKAKTVALKVTIGKRAKASTPLAITGGGLSARKTLLLRKPKPKPKPKPTKGGLPGTFWWWNDYSFNQPFDIYALRFFDNGYAYYRLPEEKTSVPDKCTSVTAKPDEDGEWGPGCVKWTLEDGKVTISDPRFQLTYSGGKLAVRDAEDTFKVDGLAAPKPGQRFNLSYNNIETSGLCGAPGSYCSVNKSFLTLQNDGRFGLQEENTSTLDIPGVSFTGVNSFPPENRGTYEVLSGFRVRLSYDDGSEAVVPFGLVNGTSDVDSNVKLVLGRLAFWPKDEDD